MKKLNERRIARDAGQAALLSTPLKSILDTYTVSVLGPRPVNSSPPAQPDTAEDQKSMDDTRKELLKFSYPKLFPVALICLFFVETIGCSLLVGNLGLENPMRTVFGIACAMGIFVITYYLNKYNKRGLRIVLTVAYVTLAIAIAVLRLGEMQAEESSFLYDVAEAIVVIFFTVGPAWLADIFIRQLALTVPLFNVCAFHKQRIDAAKNAYIKQLADAKFLKLRVQEWDVTAKRLEAIYKKYFLLVSMHIRGRQEEKP